MPRFLKALLGTLTGFLRRSGVLSAESFDHDLQRTCLGRVISTLNFLIIILCLGLWITVFILFRQSGIQGDTSQTIFTNLSCITFFGGMVAAIVFGALVGNFLRRTFWKLFMERKRG